jgi:hypothetical protein
MASKISKTTSIDVNQNKSNSNETINKYSLGNVTKRSYSKSKDRSTNKRKISTNKITQQEIDAINAETEMNRDHIPFIKITDAEIDNKSLAINSNRSTVPQIESNIQLKCQCNISVTCYKCMSSIQSANNQKSFVTHGQLIDLKMESFSYDEVPEKEEKEVNQINTQNETQLDYQLVANQSSTLTEMDIHNNQFINLTYHLVPAKNISRLAACDTNDPFYDTKPSGSYTQLINSPIKLINTSESTHDIDYLYYYTDSINLAKIFKNRRIDLESMFHDNKLVNGIILLRTKPYESDNRLFMDYYGPCVPINQTRIQTYIQFKYQCLNKSNNNLIKIDENKYLCLKSIQFSPNKNPRHDFRFTKY